MTSFHPIFHMTKFCAEQSSQQKGSNISRTDQKSNTEIGFRQIYPQFYIDFTP